MKLETLFLLRRILGKDILQYMFKTNFTLPILLEQAYNVKIITEEVLLQRLVDNKEVNTLKKWTQLVKNKDIVSYIWNYTFKTCKDHDFFRDLKSVTDRNFNIPYYLVATYNNTSYLEYMRGQFVGYYFHMESSIVLSSYEHDKSEELDWCINNQIPIFYQPYLNAPKCQNLLIERGMSPDILNRECWNDKLCKINTDKLKKYLDTVRTIHEGLVEACVNHNIETLKIVEERGLIKNKPFNTTICFKKLEDIEWAISVGFKPSETFISDNLESLEVLHDLFNKYPSIKTNEMILYIKKHTLEIDV